MRLTGHVIGLLKEYMRDLVEQARLPLYGAARERAKFFDQFQPGFELLFWRCLRDGDVEAAFATATRGPHRAL